MEKEVIIAIIGAISVIGGALITSGFFQNSDDEKYEIVEANDDKVNEPPSLTRFEPDKPSPQGIGTTVKWTANATDPDGRRLEYRFSVKNVSDDQWLVGRTWKTQNFWDWKPSEAGTYDVQVEVRNSKGDTDNWTVSYDIKEKEPPIFKSFKPDKNSPEDLGATIIWTATMEDPDNEFLNYRFQLNGPTTLGSWEIVQDWSNQSQWNWNPIEVGRYVVRVEVRDTEGWYESRNISYVIESAPEDKMKVAYLYCSDLATAESYKSLLASEGFVTILLYPLIYGNADSDMFDLIIIGPDFDSNVTMAFPTKIPIIGLGMGGYEFFKELELYIGSNGEFGNEGVVRIRDNSDSIFNEPYKIPKGDVRLYNDTDHVAIPFPALPGGIALIASEVDDLYRYPIVLQNGTFQGDAPSGTYLLWGFSASPDKMTSEGKELFVNLAHALSIDSYDPWEQQQMDLSAL